MKKILGFVESQTEAPAIRLEWGEEFYQAAKELSEFIHSLPLSAEDNDRLINLVIDQVCEAERGAFANGFRMGREFDQWEETTEQENDPLPPS